MRALLSRLRGVLPNAKKDRERADEIEANLQLHIDDNIRQGMTPAQARREAMLKLGGLEPTKEAYRDQATFPLLEICCATCALLCASCAGTLDSLRRRC
jgi:hypothetical protein